MLHRTLALCGKSYIDTVEVLLIPHRTKFPPDLTPGRHEALDFSWSSHSPSFWVMMSLAAWCQPAAGTRVILPCRTHSKVPCSKCTTGKTVLLLLPMISPPGKMTREQTGGGGGRANSILTVQARPTNDIFPLINQIWGGSRCLQGSTAHHGLGMV